MDTVHIVSPALPALPSRFQSGRHGRMPDFPTCPVTNLPRFCLTATPSFIRDFGMPPIDEHFVRISEQAYACVADTETVIQLIAKTGTGAFGNVYYARIGNSEPVALKIVPQPASTCNTPRVMQLTREMLMCGIPPHRNLVRMHVAFTCGENNYLVHEFCDGGSLTDVFDHCITNNWTPRHTDLMSVFLQLARAIRHLHGRNIVHRDIKPDNILFTSRDTRLVDGVPVRRRPLVEEPLSSFRVKLCDFGLVRHCEGNTGMSMRRPGMTVSAGTKLWMAPEATRSDGRYGKSVDVYAWGVCALQMLAKQPPKFFRRPGEQIRDGMAGRLIPPSTPAVFTSLVLSALADEPSRRPTIDEIVMRLKNALLEAGAVLVQAADCNTASFVLSPHQTEGQAYQ